MDISRDWILKAVSEHPNATRSDLLRIALPPDADIIQRSRANEILKKKLRSLCAWGDLVAEGEGSRWDPLRYRLNR